MRVTHPNPPFSGRESKQRNMLPKGKMSLIEFLIVEALHIRIDTTDNIEDHTHDDDES